MSDGFSISTAARALDGVVSRLVHDLVAPPPHPGEEWHSALARFHGVRDKTTAMLRVLTQKQIDFPPAEGAWSIGQIVDHLLLSEKLYRTQIEKLIAMAREGKETTIHISLQQVNSSFAFVPREVMQIFGAPMKMFNMFVPHAVRETLIRFPLIAALNPSVSEPVRGRPLEELCSSLQSSIGQTEALFTGQLPQNLKQMTLSHPILGNNNIEQILGILAAHEERHQGQMRAVMVNARFPKRSAY
jgi:uncharacterized damage-inducible protein DinB